MARLKLLSIGLPLEDPAFTVADFGAATTLSNYDAVVVHMGAVSEFLESVIKGVSHHDSLGLSIVNDPGSLLPGQLSLGELIDRRTREADQLLGTGGLLVCILARPEIHAVRGRGSCSTYDWCPQPIGDMYHPAGFLAGDGLVERLVADYHPFAQFFRAFQGKLRYRAYFPSDSRLIVPIAVSYAGLIVAGERAHKEGRLIFLPSVEVEEGSATKLAGVLKDCIVRALTKDGVETEPDWVGEWHLPGLEELDEKVADARQQVQAAQGSLQLVQQRRDRIAEFRKLLWATGKFQLQPVVREAFSLLGFDAKEEEGDRDVVLYELGRTVAIVEIEGSEDAIDITKLRQLLDYVQEELDKDEQVKGILVGNGYRRKLPGERGVQFTDKCMRRAKDQRYCLMPTSELFEIVKAVLEDPSEDIKKSSRQRILQTVGVYCFGLKSPPPSL